MTTSTDVNPERRKHESVFQVDHWTNRQMFAACSVMLVMSTFVQRLYGHRSL